MLSQIVDKHENNSILFCSIYLILLTGYLLTYVSILFSGRFYLSWQKKNNVEEPSWLSETQLGFVVLRFPLEVWPGERSLRGGQDGRLLAENFKKQIFKVN